MAHHLGIQFLQVSHTVSVMSVQLTRYWLQISQLPETRGYIMVKVNISWNFNMYLQNCGNSFCMHPV